jgi:flagellar biosynthesis repressor protein FlbT
MLQSPPHLFLAKWRGINPAILFLRCKDRDSRTARGAGEEAKMTLKVELKPGERMILGECVVTNGNQRTRLTIDGTMPLLREKDIMTAELADTPAKRLYLAVQLMYTSRDPQTHHDVYFALMRDIVQAAPTTWPFIENINNHILMGNLYKALKDAKKLIEYEREILANAQRGAGVRKSSKADREPA